MPVVSLQAARPWDRRTAKPRDGPGEFGMFVRSSQIGIEESMSRPFGFFYKQNNELLMQI